MTATATNGKAFTYQIAASNNPASYGASGLPSGLRVNTATGLISGATTATGTSNVILSATNGRRPRQRHAWCLPCCRLRRSSPVY